MRRLPHGGRIDRARPIPFTWNGRSLTGFAGDTLASALLGNGISVIGTSVAFDRPRGVSSAGLEESTAFAQVTSATVTEPLVRMTTLPLFQGLSADGRITKGYLGNARDDARFDKRFAHCDLLVIGAGPAGLAAALEGTRANARVMLVDVDTEVGGGLLRDEPDVTRSPACDWLASVASTLGSAPDTLVLTGTTAAIMMDQNGVLLAQRVAAHRPVGERAGLSEQRLWHVRARRIILATGALERPIVFANNDRPGIMLAGAARSYLNRHALAPERGLVFTTNDDAYRTALDWHAAGVTVAGILDMRPEGRSTLRQRAIALGIPVHFESVVETTDGDPDGVLVRVRARTPAGTRTFDADLLAVSGGWMPNINLHLQLRGGTSYDSRLGATVPDRPLGGQRIAGAARGEMSLRACLASGRTAARESLASMGWRLPDVADDESGLEAEDVAEDAPSLEWRVDAPDGDETHSFIDLHRDATVAGVRRAVDAGLRHVEHVKRFTLIGTGVEQGRSAAANAGWITATLTGQTPAEVGVSGSRPPFEPLPFHLLGGRAKGGMYEPVRTTALHETHEALGARFEVAGQWLRPTCYPRSGESLRATVSRECRAARSGVAIMDASTLGKIDVRGPDAAWFLDRLYVNAIEPIPVGRARYSLLCRLDGSIFDDGLVMRTGPQRFFVTTSTGHATAVVEWMEEWLQTEWPDRRVWVTPMTEQYTTIAVVGPRARALVLRIVSDLDVSNEAFPFLAVQRATVAGIADCQVARVSFSGELAFELSVPWDRGPEVWQSLMALGADLGVVPYGLDALHALRIEKGYIVVGQDTEALTTPHDVGLGWMVSKKKDFIGRRSHERAAPRAAGRPQLVGFVRNDGDGVVTEGAGLVSELTVPPMRLEGHVSSSCWSRTLGRSLGLALVRDGRARHGEVLFAPLESGVASVTLVEPVHLDPAGARRDGCGDD